MKVQAKTLLLPAGLVWTAAGGNILRIGLETYGPYVNWTNGLISLAVFAVFWIFVFSRLVKKHTARITGYEDRQYFWRFFDGRSFAIMAGMMTGGIVLRTARLAPDWCIAVFYTGLGAALLGAGLAFGIRFVQKIRFCREGEML